MTDSEPPDDRRAAPRKTAYVGAEITSSDGPPHLAVVQDASATGLSLLTRAPLAAGEPVRVGVQVESERRITVDGEIVRREDHRGDGPWRYRLAVALTAPSEELAAQADRINARQSRPPPAPDGDG